MYFLGMPWNHRWDDTFDLYFDIMDATKWWRVDYV
jgi:hypothetical protein